MNIMVKKSSQGKLDNLLKLSENKYTVKHLDLNIKQGMKEKNEDV